MTVENGTQQESANLLDIDDFSAYVAARTHTEEPQEKPSEATGEKPAEPEPAPESDPAENDQELNEDEPVTGRRLQKRFSKLTAEIRDLRAQVAAKDTGIASPKPADAEPTTEAKAEEGKPDPSKFATYELYEDAILDWKLDQREKAKSEAERRKAEQDTAQQAERKFAESVGEVQKRPEYADYADVVSKAAIPVPPGIAQAILTDPHGAELLYALAKDTARAQEVLRMPTVEAIRELGRMSAKFDKVPDPPKPPVSKAPPPVKPVSSKSGQASEEKDLYDEEDFSVYAKRREAQLRRK